MELLIIRKWKKKGYTIGKFFIDGNFICNSMEDEDRGLRDDMSLEEIKRIKVYGETAIPTGTYKVILSYSPKFKRITPEIIGVKGYTGIRIHAGNDAKDSLGCVLPGKNDKVGWVSNSKYYEELITNKLQGHDDINITIE